MTELAKAKTICTTVHKVLDNTDEFKSTRCLYTTTVIMDLFQQHNIECKLWQGGTRWYSKKYMELLHKGYDFSQLKSQIKPDLAKKKADALRRKGVLEVSCLANQAMNHSQLGGHVAILAKLDGKYYLIDPTSYQFQRNQSEHGAKIEAPVILYYELLAHEYSNPGDLMYTTKAVGAVYQYTTLTSISALTMKTEQSKLTTDLNPKKYLDTYNLIQAELSHLK